MLFNFLQKSKNKKQKTKTLFAQCLTCTCFFTTTLFLYQSCWILQLSPYIIASPFFQIRDPPPDGEMFVYGAYVWACAYERSTNGDFQEIPPKQVPVPLPVLHLTASILKSNVYEPPSQTATFTTEQKGPYAYHCPCFFSNAVRHAMALKDSDKGRGSGPHQARNRELNQDILFTVTMTNSEMNPAKWSTRNVACTLRPF